MVQPLTVAVEKVENAGKGEIGTAATDDRILFWASAKVQAFKKR
jgi:hypothetical protein